MLITDNLPFSHGLLRLLVEFLGTKYYPRLYLTSLLKIILKDGLQVLQVRCDHISIPFAGYITSELNNGIIEDLIGRVKPDLCSHLVAICSKRSIYDKNLKTRYSSSKLIYLRILRHDTSEYGS